MHSSRRTGKDAGPLPIRRIAMGFAALIGCAGPTLVGRSIGENPLHRPDALSSPVAIAIKDVQILGNAGQAVSQPERGGSRGMLGPSGAQYYHPTFHQSALFQVRGDGEIVFLVELAHRWPELTHAWSYEVTLVDDRGRRVRPVDVRSAPARVIYRSMELAHTDFASATVVNQGGQAYTHTRGNAMQGVMNTNSLGRDENSDNPHAMLAARNLIVFRGPDLLTPSSRQLSLELKSRHWTLVFVWELAVTP